MLRNREETPEEKLARIRINRQNEEIKRREQKIKEDKEFAERQGAIFNPKLSDNSWPRDLAATHVEHRYEKRDHENERLNSIQSRLGPRREEFRSNRLPNGVTDGPPPDPRSFLADDERDYNTTSNRSNFDKHSNYNNEHIHTRRSDRGRGVSRGAGAQGSGARKIENKDIHWREERQYIDEERLQRQKTVEGNWKREWDRDKVEEMLNQRQETPTPLPVDNKKKPLTGGRGLSTIRRTITNNIAEKEPEPQVVYKNDVDDVLEKMTEMRLGLGSLNISRAVVNSTVIEPCANEATSLNYSSMESVYSVPHDMHHPTPTINENVEYNLSSADVTQPSHSLGIPSHSSIQNNRFQQHSSLEASDAFIDNYPPENYVSAVQEPSLNIYQRPSQTRRVQVIPQDTYDDNLPVSQPFHSSRDLPQHQKLFENNFYGSNQSSSLHMTNSNAYHQSTPENIHPPLAPIEKRRAITSVPVQPVNHLANPDHNMLIKTYASSEPLSYQLPARHVLRPTADVHDNITSSAHHMQSGNLSSSSEPTSYQSESGTLIRPSEMSLNVDIHSLPDLTVPPPPLCVPKPNQISYGSVPHSSQGMTGSASTRDGSTQEPTNYNWHQQQESGSHASRSLRSPVNDSNICSSQIRDRFSLQQPPNKSYHGSTNQYTSSEPVPFGQSEPVMIRDNTRQNYDTLSNAQVQSPHFTSQRQPMSYTTTTTSQQPHLGFEGAQTPSFSSQRQPLGYDTTTPEQAHVGYEGAIRTSANSQIQTPNFSSQRQALSYDTTTPQQAHVGYEGAVKTSANSQIQTPPFSSQRQPLSYDITTSQPAHGVGYEGVTKTHANLQTRTPNFSSQRQPLSYDATTPQQAHVGHSGAVKTHTTSETRTPSFPSQRLPLNYAVTTSHQSHLDYDSVTSQNEVTPSFVSQRKPLNYATTPQHCTTTCTTPQSHVQHFGSQRQPLSYATTTTNLESDAFYDCDTTHATPQTQTPPQGQPLNHPTTEFHQPDRGYATNFSSHYADPQSQLSTGEQQLNYGKISSHEAQISYSESSPSYSNLEASSVVTSSDRQMGYINTSSQNTDVRYAEYNYKNHSDDQLVSTTSSKETSRIDTNTFEAPLVSSAPYLSEGNLVNNSYQVPHTDLYGTQEETYYEDQSFATPYASEGVKDSLYSQTNVTPATFSDDTHLQNYFIDNAHQDCNQFNVFTPQVLSQPKDIPVPPSQFGSVQNRLKRIQQESSNTESNKLKSSNTESNKLKSSNIESNKLKSSNTESNKLKNESNNNTQTPSVVGTTTKTIPTPAEEATTTKTEREPSSVTKTSHSATKPKKVFKSLKQAVQQNQECLKEYLQENQAFQEDVTDSTFDKVVPNNNNSSVKPIQSSPVKKASNEQKMHREHGHAQNRREKRDGNNSRNTKNYRIRPPSYDNTNKPNIRSGNKFHIAPEAYDQFYDKDRKYPRHISNQRPTQHQQQQNHHGFQQNGRFHLHDESFKPFKIETPNRNTNVSHPRENYLQEKILKAKKGNVPKGNVNKQTSPNENKHVLETKKKGPKKQEFKTLERFDWKTECENSELNATRKISPLGGNKTNLKNISPKEKRQTKTKEVKKTETELRQTRKKKEDVKEDENKNKAIESETKSTDLVRNVEEINTKDLNSNIEEIDKNDKTNTIREEHDKETTEEKKNDEDTVEEKKNDEDPSEEVVEGDDDEDEWEDVSDEEDKKNKNKKYYGGRYSGYYGRY